MIRNFKTPCLAFVAVFAISASAAQASEAHFTADSPTSKAVLTAEQDPNAPHQVLTTEFGAVDCSMFNAEATVENTGTTATFTNIKYFGTTTNTTGNCTFGGIAASVNMNGCHFTFHAGTFLGASSSSGTVDLTCTESGTTKGLVITVGGVCTIKVHNEQNGLSSVTYTTVEAGGKKHITANLNITKIKYTAEGPGCPGNPTATEDGTYEGRMTIKAYEDKESGEGAQVNASITST